MPLKLKVSSEQVSEPPVSTRPVTSTLRLPGLSTTSGLTSEAVRLQEFVTPAKPLITVTVKQAALAGMSALPAEAFTVRACACSAKAAVDMRVT